MSDTNLRQFASSLFEKIKGKFATKDEVKALTKADVGLGNVDNTADTNKTVAVANSLSGEVYCAPYYSYSFFGSATDTNSFYQNYIKRLVTSHQDLSGKVLIGLVNPNSNAIIIFQAYSLDNYKNGYPQYCYGMAIHWSNSIDIFGTSNGDYFYRQL